MRITLNVKSILFVLMGLAVLPLAGCFGSANKEAGANTFGLKIELAEYQTAIPVGSIGNTLTVRLFDKTNKPAANFDVVFTYLGTSDLLIENQVIKTDVNGYASTTYRAPYEILTGEKIRAKVRDLDLEETFTFDTISAGPAKPHHLVFTQNPPLTVDANLDDMDDMGPIKLEVYDQYNHLYVPDTTDASPDPTVQVELGLSLGTNGLLSGTKLKTPLNSTVTFDDIAYSKAETIRFQAKLIADGGNISSLLSPTYTIVNPNVPFYIGVLAPGQILNSGVATAAAAIVNLPTDQKAGVNFDVTTLVLDQAFNISNILSVSGYTIAYSPSNGANTISKPAIADGQANLRVEPKLANQTLSITPGALFSGSPLTAIPSTPINVGAGLPDHLLISQQPSLTATAGAAFGQKIKIQILDKYNNLSAAAVNSITVSAFTDTCSTAVTDATKLKSFQVAAVGGVATFTALNYEKAEIIHLRGSSTGLVASDCSTAVDVSPAAVASLAWLQKPGANSQQVAGLVLAPTPIVRLTDSFNNRVSAATSIEVKVYTNSSCTTALASQTPAPVSVGSRSFATETSINGDATFGQFTVNLAGNGYYIKADDGTFSTTCHGPINFDAGAANSLVFSPDFPTTHSAHLSLSTTPTIRVIDSYGNTKAAAGQQIDVLPYDSAVGLCQNVLAGKTYSGGSSLSIASGSVALSSFLYRSAGSVRFGAILKNTAVSGCSANITVVSPGPANALAWVAALPGSVTAVQKLSDVGPVQVRVTDQWNNPVQQSLDVQVTAHTDTLCSDTSLAESTTPKGDASLEFATVTTNASGIGTFSNLAYHRARDVYFKAVATSVTLAGTPPCSAKVTITPGAASTIKSAVAVPGVSISADNTFSPSPIFNLVDVYENILKSTSAVITLTPKVLNCGGVATTNTLENGAKSIDASGNATFSNLAYRKAETIGLVVSTDAAGVSNICWGAVTIDPGAPKKIVFDTQPVPGPTVAGMNFAVTPVKARLNDNWLNPVANDSFSISLGVYNDAICSDAQLGSGTLTGGSPLSTSGGIATYSNLSYTKADTGLHLKAFIAGNSTIDTACSTAFAIKHASPAKILLATGSSFPASQDVGSAFPSFDLKLYDQYTNLVDTGGPYTIQVNGYQSDCSTLHYAGTQTPQGSFPKVVLTANQSSAGVFTLSDLNYRITGPMKLKFSITGIIDSGSNPTGMYCSPSLISMTSTTPSSVTWVTNPIASPNSADNYFGIQPRFDIIDVYGNHVTATKNAKIDVYTNSGCSTPGSPSKTVNNTMTSNTSGVAAFSNFAYRLAAATPIYLKATVDSISSLTNDCLASAPITVDPGVINKLIAVTQPSASANAGVALSPQPALSIKDAWDNVVPTNSEAILYSLHQNDASCGVASIKGSVPNNSNDAVLYSAVTSVNGVATATDLRMLYAGTQMYLKAYLNSDNSKSVCFNATNVKAAVPDSITLAAGYSVPGSVRKADELFPTQTYSMFDTYGNTANGSSYDAVVEFYSESSCTTVANPTYKLGTFTKSTATGSVAFADLQYVKSGSLIFFRASQVGNSAVKTSCSSVTTINPGTPAKVLVVQESSTSGVAGTALVPSPSIKITDAYDNDTTLATGIEIIPLLNSNATCSSGTTVAASSYDYTNKGSTNTSNGAFAFGALALNVAGTYRLKFQAPSASPPIAFGCSAQDLVIAPGNADKILITSTLPTTNRAHVPFNISASLRDSFGNVITGAAGNGNVTATFYNNAGNCSVAAPNSLATSPVVGAYKVAGTVDTSAVATASNGLVTFTNFNYRKAGTYQIKLDGLGVQSDCMGATGGGNSTTGTILVQAADPAIIEVPTLASPRSATSPWTGLVFSLKDAYANVADVTGYPITFSVWQNAACTTASTASQQASLVTTPASFSITGGTSTLTSMQMQRAGSWGLKASIAGFPAADTCWNVLTDVVPGTPTKVIWVAGPSLNGQILLAGAAMQNLSSPAPTMPKVAIADQYDNVTYDTGTNGVSGKVMTLDAYGDANCSPGQAIINTDKYSDNTYETALSYTYDHAIDASGTATVNALIMKKSLPTSIFFKASTTSLGSSVCSPTGILVQTNSLSFMRMRSLDNNGGVEILTNPPVYTNTDPVFWAAGYDVYGNYKGDQAATWTLWRMADTTTPITGLSGSGARSNTSIQSGTTGAGLFRVQAAVGGILKPLDNVEISLQQPVGFRVTLVSPPALNKYVAGAPIQVLIQAIDSANAVVTSFQGIKTIKFTHNQGPDDNQAQNRAGGCSGNVTNNYVQTDLLFSNGQTTYTLNNGLRFAQVGAVVTASMITSPFFSSATPSMTILAGSSACVKILDPSNVFYQDPTSPVSGLDTTFNVKLASVDTYGNYIADEAGTWSASGNFNGLLQGNLATPSIAMNFMKTRVGSSTLTAVGSSGTATATLNATSYGDKNFDATSSTFFNSYSLRSVGFYDSVLDTLGTTWRHTLSSTWHSESSSSTRSSKAEFPAKALVVGTETSLEILDATQNTSWMRFLAGNNKAIDSSRGRPMAVSALNGRIVAGLKNASEDRGSLLIMDFKRDIMYRLRSDTSLPSDSMSFTGIASRNNGSAAWSTSTVFPVPASLIVNAVDQRKVGGYGYLAVGTKTGVLVYRIDDQFDPAVPTDVFSVSYAAHTINGGVNGVKITSAGDLYYAVTGVGIYKAALGSITYASSNSGSFTGTLVYSTTNPAARASLTQTTFTSLDVLEGSSLNSGYNLLAIGTTKGVTLVHEGSSLSTAQSRFLTYRGSGPAFFNNAAEFDGVNDYVSVPYKSSMPSSEGIVDFWFRPDDQIDSTSNTTQTLLYRGSGGAATSPFKTAGNFALQLLPGGQLDFSYGVGSKLEAKSVRTQWFKGTRYHVRAAWRWTDVNSITLSLWVNGSLEVTANFTGITTLSHNNAVANATGIFLGGSITGTPSPMGANQEFFTGSIDELLIRNLVADDNFTDPFTEPTVAFTSSEPNAAYLLHFDSIWNGTAFGVATDAMGSNAGGDPTYVNGATSSYPILSGFSRSVAQIAGVANATNPKIMVATQLNQGNYSEVSALQGSTPSLALSRNLESVGLTLYHVENVNDVDVAIIQRDQNLVLIRR